MFRKLKITREKLSAASDLLKKSNLYSLQYEANEESNKWNQKRGKGILSISVCYCFLYIEHHNPMQRM